MNVDNGVDCFDIVVSDCKGNLVSSVFIEWVVSEFD